MGYAVRMGVLLASVTLVAEASGAPDKRFEHRVEQAMLYLKMKQPDRAVEALKNLIRTVDRAQRPLAQLALARLHYRLRDIEAAGAAFIQAEAAGAEILLPRAGDWARDFFYRFQQKVGRVQLKGPCPEVEFPVKLATPIVDRTRRELLRSVPGWTAQRLKRPTGTLFFMPTGVYQWGPRRVRVEPGAPLVVLTEVLGDVCPPKTALAQTTVVPVTPPIPGSEPPLPPPLDKLLNAPPRTETSTASPVAATPLVSTATQATFTQTSTQPAFTQTSTPAWVAEPTATATTAPWLTAQTQPTSGPVQFLEDHWVWLAIAGVVLIAGGSAIGAAASSRDPPETEFYIRP